MSEFYNSPVNGAIIYLIGYSGCGKRTIAKAIQARLDCIVAHNQLINKEVPRETLMLEFISNRCRI